VPLVMSKALSMKTLSCCYLITLPCQQFPAIVWITDGIAGVLTLEGLGTLWTPGMMESDLQAFDRSQGLHYAMFHSCIL